MFKIMMQAWSIRLSLIALYFSGLGAALAFETVVIDAGHGGHDEGAMWFRVQEKLITLSVAKRLEDVLREKGIHTVMTRSYDHYVSLDERAEKGNNIRNSLFVSIHFNAISDTSVHGFESFYHGDSAKVIARSIQEAMVEKLPSRSLGVKKRDFAVITRTNELAVLIESGFISSKAESARLKNSAYQQQLAEAIALGIIRIKPLINTDPMKDLETLREEHERKKAEAAAAVVAKKVAPPKQKPAKKKQ